MSPIMLTHGIGFRAQSSAARAILFWRAVGCLMMVIYCVCVPHVAFGSRNADNVLCEFTFYGYAGLVCVPVTFGGVTYEFLIDTGCEFSHFTPELSLLLAKTQRTMTLVGTGSTVRVPLYRSPVGSIGPLALPPLDAVSCYDDGCGQVFPSKIYGHLGMDALRQFIIQIDYDRGTISFLRSVPFDAGVRVPLDERSRCPTIICTLGLRKWPFTLDTGFIHYGAACVTRRDFDDLIARGDLSVAERQPAFPTYPGEQRAGILNVAMSVGGRSHDALAVTELQNPDCHEGMLGAGYLRRYVTTFDFPNRAAYFARGAGFRNVDATHDPGGVQLRRDRGRIVVCGVTGWRRGALEAGVRVNDILIRVNGRETDSMDKVALAHSLSESDDPTSMVFWRPTNGRTITFVYDEAALRAHVLGRLGASQHTADEAHLTPAHYRGHDRGRRKGRNRAPESPRFRRPP